MRQVLRELAACGLLLGTLPIAADAQQGSIKVSAAAHALAGDPPRIGAQESFEPDLGVSWLRPGTRFGTFEIELRGTTRKGDPHVGRSFLSLRDFRYRGVTYTFEAGDSFFSPRAGDNQVRNIYTPAINFVGVSAKARTPRTEAAVMLGRATTSRNIFGTDAETLDQGLLVGRGSYRATDRLELSARASRIRTRDLKHYIFTISSSDQAGGGARFVLTPAVHIVTDASVVRYRRRDSDEMETDGSALAGVSLLLARGWFQFNTSRFSPGELPIIAQPHADRQTLYAAGEYDVFSHVRVFGGWEAFRTNLDGRVSARSTPSDGGRAFGGLRVPLGGGSSASFRIEDGDRRSRLVNAGLTRVSDTGVVSGELQSAWRRLSAFARFARRENVESDSVASSYTQSEASGLAFFNPNRELQLFGSVTATRNEARDGSGRTYWQFGGGTQAQVFRRSLWLRGEGLFSRNLDLLSELSVPQQTVNIGLNGEIAPNTVLGFNIYADRMQPGTSAAHDSWLVRSTIRVTRTFITSSSATPRSLLGAGASRHGGTGSLTGLVYTDWNANGLQDEDEPPVQNIPIRLIDLGNASTSGSGEFAFVNAPIGLRQVGIDMTSLPVDFDPPAVPQVQVQLVRGETERVAFGLIPLGSIGGRIVRDVNSNGAADDGDQPVGDAVVVLDGGARSEQARNGHFRFDAVRSGEHTVTLLQESLPGGSTILGAAEARMTVGRESLAPETTFLVSIQARPEIRRVFPGGQPVANPPATPAAPASRAKDATSRANRPPARSAGTARPSTAPPASRTGQFAIQIAALSDPSRAERLVEQLRESGYSAYIVAPPASDPDAPYRVRVGSFASRAAAEEEARRLERARGQKVWVIRER